jgi:hypothetical protein
MQLRQSLNLADKQAENLSMTSSERVYFHKSGLSTAEN